MRRIFPTNPKITWSEDVMHLLAVYIQVERSRYKPENPWHAMIGDERFKKVSPAVVKLVSDYCRTGAIHNDIQICRSLKEKRPTWEVRKCGLNVWNNLDHEDEQRRAAA